MLSVDANGFRASQGNKIRGNKIRGQNLGVRTGRSPTSETAPKKRTASKIEAESLGSHCVKVNLIVAPSEYRSKSFAGRNRARVSSGLSFFETSSRRIPPRNEPDAIRTGSCDLDGGAVLRQSLDAVDVVCAIVAHKFCREIPKIAPARERLRSGERMAGRSARPTRSAVAWVTPSGGLGRVVAERLDAEGLSGRCACSRGG